MPEYKGSCHCGTIQFQFTAETIDSGARCNCSICKRKGAIMTTFTVSPDDIKIQDGDKLGSYQFGDCIAIHHFCSECGIYTFHQTKIKPGHYRINIGCVAGIDSTELPFSVFDGASW